MRLAIATLALACLASTTLAQDQPAAQDGPIAQVKTAPRRSAP